MNSTFGNLGLCHVSMYVDADVDVGVDLDVNEDFMINCSTCQVSVLLAKVVSTKEDVLFVWISLA